MDPTSNTPAGASPVEPNTSKSDGLAMVALVLGILALLTGLVYIGAFFGLGAIALGFNALKKQGNQKIGIISIFLGAAGVLLTIIALIFNINLLHINKNAPTSNTFKTVREFNKGETGKFGNLAVSADSVTRNFNPADASQKAEDGKELVVVKVTVSNQGKTTVSLTPDDFKLETSDGLNYGAGFAAAPDAEFKPVSLAAGETQSGELVYKIKKDSTGLKLVEKGYDYNPASSRNEYVTFKLDL